MLRSRSRSSGQAARVARDEGPLLLLGAPGRARRRSWPGALVRLAAEGSGPQADPRPRLDPGHRTKAAATGRDAARAAPTRSSGSAPGRRWQRGCCASTPRPPGSIPFSTWSARRSAWRCCSTASTSCRSAGSPDPWQPGRPAGQAAGADRHPQGRRRAAGAGPGRALRRPRSHPRRVGQHRPWRCLPDPQQAPPRAARGSRRNRRPLLPRDGRRVRGRHHRPAGDPPQARRRKNPNQL